MTEEELYRLERNAFEIAKMQYTGLCASEVRTVFALARVGLAVTTWKIPQTVSLSRAGGVEGPSIYLNDYRITGPKPWGGATSMEDFKRVETRQIFAALGFPLSSLPKPGGE